MPIFLSTDGLSTKKLEETIRENIKTAANLRSEISKFEKLDISQIVRKENKPVLKFKDDEEKIDKNDEYDYYYENIKKMSYDLSDDEMKEIIKESLPVKQNSNYNNIILNIKYKIEKEIFEYCSLIDEVTDKEELDEIKKIISYLKKKIEFIDNIEEENKKSNNTVIKNDVVFLTSNTGRIYPIDDLSNIPAEYYSELFDLYNSIIDGTFKKVRRFNSTHKGLKGLAEVRGFQIRIIFDRIDKDTYIILKVLVKKTNTDSIYMSSLENRHAIYFAQKEFIEDDLENNKEKNKSIREDFENILKGKKKG